MTFKVTAVVIDKVSFINDVKKLPPEVKADLANRLALLVSNPAAKKLRFHGLNGFDPKLYKIDLESGKGQRYQATFVMEGSVAVFQRAGTHKRMDRCPH